MFQIDGQRTSRSLVVQNLLEFLSSQAGEDNFVSTVYQIDPLDQYQYLLAMTGVRESEPMFGPHNSDDFRFLTPELRQRVPPNPLGFAKREGTCYLGHLKGNGWVLYANSRNENGAAVYKNVKDKLEASLASVFSETDVKEPIFPEHWFEERKACDLLRARFTGLTPGSPIENVVQLASKALQDVLLGLIPSRNKGLAVGIYLNTGEQWKIYGGDSPPLPKTTGLNPLADSPVNLVNLYEIAIADLDACTWVARSTRSIFV